MRIVEYYFQKVMKIVEGGNYENERFLKMRNYETIQTRAIMGKYIYE